MMRVIQPQTRRLANTKCALAVSTWEWAIAAMP
jgi:hypothetical protein